MMSSPGITAKWAAIVTLSVLLVWFGRLAKEPAKGGPSIVHLELAPTVSAANAFMRAWQAAGKTKDDLNNAQSWDTWFICAYAPLFALLCWVSAQYVSLSFPRLGALGFALAALQLFAGALDFVENACMQRTIDAGLATQPWPMIGATASGIKWLLILMFVAYGTAAALDCILRAARR